MTFRHPLTPAQIAIMRRLEAGLQAKHIAAERGRALRTVETQICEAMHRLGATTRTQAVAMCIRAGWLG